MLVLMLMLKKYISNEILHLPTKFDEDGKITEILIYSMKDLRQER